MIPYSAMKGAASDGVVPECAHCRLLHGLLATDICILSKRFLLRWQ